MNVWNNQHVIKTQTAGVDVEFKKYPENRQLFIEDLRKVDYRLTGLNQEFPLATQQDTDEVVDAINSFYDNYYDVNMNTFNTVAGIPVGCPIILNVESYKDIWDEAESTWWIPFKPQEQEDRSKQPQPLAPDQLAQVARRQQGEPAGDEACGDIELNHGLAVALDVAAQQMAKRGEESAERDGYQQVDRGVAGDVG